MIYGYARVSTLVQAKDGNSLESQIEKLKAAGAEEIYSENFTGTTTDRPKLNELLAKLQPGDTLCVCKLDRFARTVAQGNELIRRLVDRNIKVHILNMGVLENTPIGKIICTVLLAFAEFERDIIVERCQEGLRVARTKEGFHIGRPRVRQKAIDNALQLLETMSYKEVEEITGISASTLVRRKREAKLKKTEE